MLLAQLLPKGISTNLFLTVGVINKKFEINKGEEVNKLNQILVSILIFSQIVYLIFDGSLASRKVLQIIQRFINA